jgi:hypothetical protein
MTTYTILRLEPGQTIPRPFNRASSKAELAELIHHFVTYNQREKKDGPAKARRAAKEASERAATDVASGLFTAGMTFSAIDTEEPVFVAGKTKFFAFSEQ